MELESLYKEIIHDHYRSPHHAGLREPFDAQVHLADPPGEDEVTVRVTLSDTVGEPVLADVSYQALGCAINQASTSIMADLLIGKTVDEAMAISDAFLKLMQSRGNIEPDEDMLEDAVALAGLSRYPSRIKCALLCWMAWKEATTLALSQLD
jgi:nitrogen fixation protein NifU and related proteins